MWSYEVVPEDEESYEELNLEDRPFPHWKVVEESSSSGFHGSEPAFNAVSLAEGSMYPFQPKGLERLGIPGALINEDEGLVHARLQHLPQEGLCMEDVPLPGNSYSQQLTRIDIYGSPHVAPFSISLNLSLVNSYHSPRFSFNVDGYVFQLLNPKPNGFVTTWNNSQNIGYVSVAQASHVKQDRSNLHLKRKPITLE